MTATADTTQPADHDDILIEVTQAEFEASAQRALDCLGLTYTQLEEQAQRRGFSSPRAHVLWVSIGGTVDL